MDCASRPRYCTGSSACRLRLHTTVQLSRCAQKGLFCSYAFNVISLCDQGPGQRKAFGELNAASVAMREELEEHTGNRALLDPRYMQPAHGILHGAKNCVGSARNYRLTDGKNGEASLRMLVAIATSDTPEAAELARVASRDVFRLLDCT